MSNVIGIRSTPSIIYYSIVEFDENGYQWKNESLIIPKSFDKPQQLKYIRKTLLDIFNEYKIVNAGIRITEHSSFGSPDNGRVMIEGVIQEMIASSTVTSYFTGVKASIGKRLNITNDGSISDVMEGTTQFKEITNWSDIKSEHRESLMVAFASKKD
jgi:hypothetical protein